jgi:hypothetical protein
VENIVSYEELLSSWDEAATPTQRLERAQLALAELEHFGFVFGIKVNDCSCSEEILLDAISSCLRVDELRVLLKLFCRKTSSSFSRGEAIRELRRGLRGQRTLGSFFSTKSSPSGGELPRAVKWYVQPVLQLEQGTFENSPPGQPHASIAAFSYLPPPYRIQSSLANLLVDGAGEQEMCHSTPSSADCSSLRQFL